MEKQKEAPHPQPLSQPATVLPECIRALAWPVGGREEPEYEAGKLVKEIDQENYWEVPVSFWNNLQISLPTYKNVDSAISLQHLK